MYLRLIYILSAFFLTNASAYSTSALSKELNAMLDSSHSLKASYYAYLESIASQELTQASSNPSYSISLSPYQYSWSRTSSDPGISGGIVGDLGKVSKVSGHFLNNIGHMLDHLDNGVPLQYDEVWKTDNTSSSYSAGISHTFIDFGASKAQNEMAKLSTKNTFNDYESSKQSHILQGLTVYAKIVASKKIIYYAQQVKQQINSDIIKNKETDLRGADLEKAKRMITTIDSIIVEQQSILSKSMSTYKYLFHHEPTDIDDFKLLTVSKDQLPKSKSSFVQSVKTQNLELANSRISIQNSKENYKLTHASEYPTISGSLSSSLSFNEGGKGFETDSYSVSFSVNYGGTFFTNGHKNKQAKLSILQSQEQYKDLESSTLNQAEQAWSELSLSKEQLDLQIKGIKESDKYITKTIEEYLNGTRSLIDVFEAKVEILKQSIVLINLYNAYTIQSFNILKMKNELNYKNIKTMTLYSKPVLDKALIKKIALRKKPVDDIDHLANITLIDEWLS